MEHLNEFLAPIYVELKYLLMDPNNPRFAELGGDNAAVPESRFAEPKVQQATYDKMRNTRFNVLELRDTIRELGFLKMDRLVVRKWQSCSSEYPYYVVVEGNRRVAALRWLLELFEQGKLQFTEDQISSFRQLEVLLLDEDRAPNSARLILPGLRHVSGIKGWGPYQKACMVFELRSTGRSPQEVAQSLGLSTREANQLWRAYLALKQMESDEEYGEHVEASFYSFFEEVFKRPNVRAWLGWSDEEQKFANEEELYLFYSWICGSANDDDEDQESPKLPEAKSVRELSRVIADADAFTIFKAPSGTLTRALARVEADSQRDFIPTVAACDSVLSSLSPDRIRNMSQSEIEKLEHLSSRISQLLRDRESLMPK